MQFILSHDWEEGIASLTRKLVDELTAGKRVLWLVSGGSNIPACVRIMGNIPNDLTQNLSVMLADERYGEVGHTESNWAKLLQSGFDPAKATLYPVLEANLSFDRAVERFNMLANQAFAENDTIIAQLGMGADGHVAGILPDSPATREGISLVAGYQGPDFVRLTLSFTGLRKVTQAYVFAFGAPKKTALENLKAGSLTLPQQPAQILRELPEAYIYNDQIGDK